MAIFFDFLKIYSFYKFQYIHFSRCQKFYYNFNRMIILGRIGFFMRSKIKKNIFIMIRLFILNFMIYNYWRMLIPFTLFPILKFEFTLWLSFSSLDMNKSFQFPIPQSTFHRASSVYFCRATPKYIHPLLVKQTLSILRRYISL